MRNLQNKVWITVPHGFTPGKFRINFGSLVAISELFFFQKRKTPGELKFYYPPPWSSTLSSAQEKIFKAAQFWLIVLPVIVGVASALPINFSLGPLSVATTGEFNLSLTMRASYLSALFLFFAFLVQYFAIPKFIKEYGKSFHSLPPNITEEEIKSAYVGFATGGLPQKIGIGSISCSRYPGGSYTLGITTEVEYTDGSSYMLPEGPAWGYMSYLLWRLSGPLQWQAARDHKDYFDYDPTYLTSRPEPGKETKPQLPIEDLEAIASDAPKILEFETLGLSQIIEDSAYPHQIEFIFPVVFGQLKLREEETLACYRRCYQDYDHSRSLPRFAFWVLFLIGSGIGALVFLKLLFDGASIILF